MAWYLDLVLPSEYGTSLPPYFIFLPSFWYSCLPSFLKSKKTSGKENVLKKPLLEGDVSLQEGFQYSHLSRGLIDPEDIDQEAIHDAAKTEPVSTELLSQLNDGRAIRIRGLVKKFSSPSGGADLVAVDHLNLDLFEGQISVLLGHNGAGIIT